MTADEVLDQVVASLIKVVGVPESFMREAVGDRVRVAYRNALDRYKSYALDVEDDRDLRVRVGSARRDPQGGWTVSICVRGRSEALVTVHYA